ncbi:MAG: hypothetical protein NT023_16830 [Armatimonadetes bacterium]|nr:hypothetical protein [Armatimonadota bacterium]
MPTERNVKKLEGFDTELHAVIPAQEVREDIEKAIRFAVRYFPEAGRFTGRAAPLPLFAWTLKATERTPPLTVYYCFDANTVILVSVQVAERK